MVVGGASVAGGSVVGGEAGVDVEEAAEDGSGPGGDAFEDTGGTVAGVSAAGSPPAEQAASVRQATTRKKPRRTGRQGTTRREIVRLSLA